MFFFETIASPQKSNFVQIDLARNTYSTKGHSYEYNPVFPQCLILKNGIKYKQSEFIQTCILFKTE